MAQELTALELHFVSQEIQSVVSGKLEKIYQWGNDEFVFRFYTSNGKKHLRVRIPGLAHFTSKDYQGPKMPPGYCSFLRKYVSNAIVRAAYQQGFERILVFELETGRYGSLVLIIELLKPGNVILCRKEDGNLMVMNPLKNERFKDRSVLPKKEYSFPAGQADVKSMPETEIREVLLSSEKPLVKCIATELGFGGIYAEEIALRSKADKNVIPKNLESDVLERVVVEVKKIFSEKPLAFLSKGRIYPVRMESARPEKSFSSFSEGLDELFFEEKVVRETKETSRAKDKASAIIKAQEKNLNKFEKASTENQRAAELIYENYTFFSEIFESVRKMRSEKKSWKDIKEYLKEKPGFVSLNEKEKKIIFEIKE